MECTESLLESLRQEGDATPDAMVEELACSGEIPAVNAILRHLLENRQPVPGALPDRLEAWLQETRRLPARAERTRLDRAAELFAAHGVLISLILATDSLVNLYACRRGVRVLTATYRLGQDVYRRIGETAQFVLDVMAPGGLCAGGRGVTSIQKVRLMHAAIRCLIRRSGRWNQAELGVPICQEDLLGTLMTFSYTVIQNLRKLGIRVTDSQAEDYLHAWGVIGEVLGIRPEIIPRNMAEAGTVTRMIFARQQGPSPEGVQMTRALLAMHAHLMPGRRLDGSIPAVLRYLAGDRVADWMQVPRSTWDGVMRHAGLIGRIASLFQPRSAAMRKLVGELGYTMLTRQAIAVSGYSRAAFDIPTELRKVWGMGQAPAEDEAG